MNSLRSNCHTPCLTLDIQWSIKSFIVPPHNIYCCLWYECLSRRLLFSTTNLSSHLIIKIDLFNACPSSMLNQNTIWTSKTSQRGYGKEPSEVLCCDAPHSKDEGSTCLLGFLTFLATYDIDPKIFSTTLINKLELGVTSLDSVVSFL